MRKIGPVHKRKPEKKKLSAKKNSTMMQNIKIYHALFIATVIYNTIPIKNVLRMNSRDKCISPMMTFAEYFGSCLWTFKFASKVAFYR